MNGVSMALQTEPRTSSPPALRDRDWFPIVSVVVILVVLGVVITRIVRHDVVAGWTVLTTCSAPESTVVAAVSSTLDTSACTGTPTSPAHERGWPVVATVLPASAGASPEVTRVRTDSKARTITIDYRPSSTPAAEGRIVFVEVPPSALPDGPVAVTSSPQR